MQVMYKIINLDKLLNMVMVDLVKIYPLMNALISDLHIFRDYT